LQVGINTVQITSAGRPDTARARVLVTLGEDVPIGTFDEMLTYLRWFTTPNRLKELRDADLAGRATAWTAFLKATDPVPGTAEHEGLRDYFARIRVANIRFRDDAAAGWQSDRGTAFVALGDPDNIIDTGLLNPNDRVRQQIWEYRELRVQLLFVDQTGFGRWRIAPQSRGDLDVAIRRKLDNASAR
jgi:GWxTD domain-containing protein